MLTALSGYPRSSTTILLVELCSFDPSVILLSLLAFSSACLIPWHQAIWIFVTSNSPNENFLLILSIFVLTHLSSLYTEHCYKGATHKIEVINTILPPSDRNLPCHPSSFFPINYIQSSFLSLLCLNGTPKYFIKNAICIQPEYFSIIRPSCQYLLGKLYYSFRS